MIVKIRCSKFECRKDLHFLNRIYTELVPRLTATASVAQSVERWSRGRGLNSHPQALKLHFSQLVPVEPQNISIFPKFEFTTTYFNFHHQVRYSFRFWLAVTKADFYENILDIYR